MEESDSKVKIFWHDEVNHFRIINLLYKIAPSAVRVKFDREFHPSGGLERTLMTDRFKIMEPLRKKKFINQTQWDLLYPKSGVVSSTTFDLTLMICLLRNLASIPVGDILPHAFDASEAADLSRLKNYRNHFAHDGYSLTDADFELYWTDISQAIQRLGGPKFERECSDLKLFKLTEINKEILIQLINSEKAASTPDVLLKLNAERVQVWKEEEKKVVKTRALSCIENLLKTDNIIVAVGSSGSGKSTAIHHAALQLYNLEDYEIVPVYTPGKIIRYCEPNIKKVFVIDDVCGKSTIDIELVNKWTRWSADIQNIVKDYKIKILLSCRTHIYRDRSFRNLKVLTKSSCDLESEYSLSKEERNQIASKYLEVYEVNALKQMGVMDKFSFFPLLCRMYSGFGQGESMKNYDFFSNPIKVIRDDLELLMNAPDQTTFATLTLFIAYNNTINEELLSKKSGIKQVLEDISDYFHMQAHFSIRVVQSELDKLLLSYVKNTEKTFRILHEKIYDIFLSFCGEHFVDLVLEVAHKDVIRDRFVLETIQNENQNQTKDRNVINVPKGKEKQYFERIFKNIQNGFIADIFLNRQFSCMTFRQKMFQYLENVVDIKKVLLDLPSEEISNMLLSMARQCYWDMVPILLTEHVDVNVRDWEGTPLYYASVKGKNKTAKLLLEHQADPNIIGWLTKSSETPLNFAVKTRNIDLIKLLVSYQADINSKNSSCFCNVTTPLQSAFNTRNIKIMKILLEHGNNCNSFSFNGSPLHQTVYRGYLDLTKWLLEHGADPNVGDSDSNTPLHAAFKTDIVKLLLNYKADITIKNKFGETPLFSAVANNEIDIVKVFLEIKYATILYDRKPESTLFLASNMSYTDVVRNSEHNMDLNICNNKGESPLFKASEMGYSKIAKLLLEHNSDSTICNEKKQSPLFIAFDRGHVEIVKLLLENNSDPKICGENKYPSLFVASERGYTEIVKLLLENKSDPNICGENKQSPLLIASERGHTKIVQLLLENKSDPNICNINKQSPLLIASERGHTKIVQLLLEHNSDPNICNINKQSLFLASKKGHINILKLFLEYDFDPDICNHSNESTLFIASSEGHTDIVKLLLEKKCDLNICNNKSKSPLFIAYRNHHTDVIKLLSEHNSYLMCDEDTESTVHTNAVVVYTTIVDSLLKNGKIPNFCNTPLTVGYIYIVRVLLGHKFDLTICNDRNKLPLLVASRWGYTDIVKLLLEGMCNANVYNDSNETALFIASEEGYADIVRLLLEYKCDPKICDNSKKTPLFVASENGHSCVVTVLLEHNCDTNICTTFLDHSPLYIASKKGYTDIVRVLLEHNCDPNIGGLRQESPLYRASANGHFDIVELLLDHKANPNKCCGNRFSPSPLFISVRKGRTDIVRLLLENGSDPIILNDRGESPLSIAERLRDIDIIKLF